MHSVLRFVVWIIVLTLPLAATADIINVPGDQPTIQAGIDAAINGDTVLVADGTYTGAGNRDLDFGGKAITLVSENGAESCIIDCGGSAVEPHRAFIFQTGESVATILEGFTIQHGFAYGVDPQYCGGGIRISDTSSPVIRNCRLLENNAEYGGAIWCGESSSPIIDDCWISNNHAHRYAEGGDSGGIHICDLSSPSIFNCEIVNNSAADDAGGICIMDSSTPTISSCIISDNHAATTLYHYGGGIWCINTSSSIITNCLISGNIAHRGGGICFIDSPISSLTNVTFVNNVATDGLGGAIECRYDSLVSVENSILWNNGNEINLIESNAFTITYSDIQGGWTGEGNNDADPLFVNGPLGDFYLSQIASGQGVNSPCLDAGGGLAMSTCFFGSTGKTCLNYLGTRTDQVKDKGIVDMGYHYGPERRIIYVPADQPTIQAGIDAATNGDVVLVADGTYTGSGNHDLDFGGRSITVKSEYGPDSCVIDCENDTRGFHFHTGEDRDSVVEGISITNGNALHGGGIYCQSSSPDIKGCVLDANSGAGIYATHSSLRVTSCVFTNNSGGQGGGFQIDSDGLDYYPEITNCIFNNNTASSQGGGLYFLGSSPTISNCVVANNIVIGSDPSGRGGGLFFHSSQPLIINCSIVNNQADDAGGGVFEWQSYPSNITAINCIFWSNMPDQLVGEATVSYSNVQGGWPGMGNIDADPQFTTGPLSDYYLSQVAAGQGIDSPCLDTGSDLAENIFFSVPNGSFCMNHLTTRTDQVTDTGQVDIGCHFSMLPVSSGLTCIPDTGTLPFATQVCVAMNNLIDFHRTFAGRMDLTLASGTYFANWRVGYTNMSPYANYVTCWNQQLPALGSLLGDNLLELKVQDVTAAPFNQPPYPSAGDTDSSACTVTGLAP